MDGRRAEQPVWLSAPKRRRKAKALLLRPQPLSAARLDWIIAHEGERHAFKAQPRGDVQGAQLLERDAFEKNWGVRGQLCRRREGISRGRWKQRVWIESGWAMISKCLS